MVSLSLFGCSLPITSCRSPSNKQVLTKSRLVIGSYVEQSIQAVLNAIAMDKEMEPRFTQKVVDDLVKKNPGKNVIIYHAQCSKTNFKNSQHQHVEVNLATAGTKGYEVHVFESGTFDLCGDGGYRNWAFTGCVTKRDGGHVEFSKC